MAKKDGIWITGASSGIGKAVALEFAKIGCNIFVSARRTQELERLKDEAGKQGDNIYTFPCNVASSTNVEQSFIKISSEFEVSCLINIGGVTSFKHAADNSVNEINDITPFILWQSLSGAGLALGARPLARRASEVSDTVRDESIRIGRFANRADRGSNFM